MNDDLRPQKDDDDDATNARLRGLRPVPLPPERAERLLRRARQRFAAGGVAEGPLGRLYARAEPALAAAVVVVYLGWALQTAFGLVR